MRIKTADLTGDLGRILSEAKDILQGAFEAKAECEVLAEKREKEGYSIEKSGENSARICYATLPDLCRALLRVAGAKSITEVDGTEAKNCFTDFGIMADCSRNGVLSVAGAKKLIKYCAFMGYTFVGLYTEDTFEVENEPYFGYMRGRYTGEEIKELVSYGEIFGVELRPFVQTLAHLNQIVRYKDYSPIIDTNDILLIDDERTYELIDNIMASLAKNFKTRKVNIGMDEAGMVGLGKYRNLHGECDRHKLMEKHLKRVLEICDKYGFEAEMWSDMFFRLASGGVYRVDDDIDLSNVEIPENVTLCYWDYYATEKVRYSNMLKLHKRLTDRISFAGGAWKWSGFAPFNKFSIDAGKLAIDSCKENGVTQCTETCWGDDGAECSAFAVLPVLYSDAAYAYGEDMREEDFRVLTGVSFEEYLLTDKVNPHVGEDFTRNNMSKFLLYNDPLMGTFDSFVTEDLGKHFKEAGDRLSKIAKSPEFGYIFDSLSQLCFVLELKADLSIRIKKAYDANDKATLSDIAKKEIPEILKRLCRFYEAFKLQWMKENKAFGFEIQALRLGGVERRLKDAAEVLSEYADGKIERIDELEEARLPFGYASVADPFNTIFNRWGRAVSPSRIDF